MERKAHWENIYAAKAPGGVSWYRRHLETSLSLILGTGLGTDAAVIDIGGGASTLADDLLENGFGDVTVLDISAGAIAASQKRLGEKAALVKWIEADITEAALEAGRYDVWHDRAAFHFLTDAADRRRYAEQAARAVRTGGQLIVAAFAEDGPEKCSGLDVVRYSSESMPQEFGRSFRLISSTAESHITPFDTTQKFVYCHYQKI